MLCRIGEFASKELRQHWDVQYLIYIMLTCVCVCNSMYVYNHFSRLHRPVASPLPPCQRMTLQLTTCTRPQLRWWSSWGPKLRCKNMIQKWPAARAPSSPTETPLSWSNCLSLQPEGRPRTSKAPYKRHSGFTFYYLLLSLTLPLSEKHRHHIYYPVLVHE